MLLASKSRSETLAGVYVVDSHDGMLCADNHVVAGRMERQTLDGFAVREHFVGLLDARLGDVEEFDGAVAGARGQDLLLRMELEERHFVRVIVQSSDDWMALLFPARLVLIRGGLGQHSVNVQDFYTRVHTPSGHKLAVETEGSSATSQLMGSYVRSFVRGGLCYQRIAL